MLNQKEKCIYCGSTRDEFGEWIEVITENGQRDDNTTRKTICSSCSAEKFPQYYGTVAKPGALSRLKFQWRSIISSIGG
jgi:hypothetical protein